MKTLRKFRQDVDDLTEDLEVHHDLIVLEFAEGEPPQPDDDRKLLFGDEESEIEEDDGGGAPPANNVGTGHIAGAGVGPQGEPGVPVRKKLKLVNGPPVDPRLFADQIFARRPPVKMTVEDVENTFAGAKVFEVDPETYCQCRLGKGRYHRWSKYVGDSEVGNAIRDWGKANTDQPIVVMNSVTGEMLYLRHKALHNWKDKQ